MLRWLSSLRYKMATIAKCPKQAVKVIKSSDHVAITGFGICGVPMNLINAIVESNLKNLTIISNTAGTVDYGVGVLINKPGLVKRMVGSYFGNNKEFERQYLSGELEVELMPQGTLAEKLKARGGGIPAFYTPSGANTSYADGTLPIKFKKGTREGEIYPKPKETRVFSGKSYILEESMSANVALIRGHLGDAKGNIVFHKTAQNFSPDMAVAADYVIAQVDKIVPVGEIDPNHVQLPGVFVNCVYEADPKSKWSEKRIEKFMYRTKPGEKVVDTSPGAKVRAKIAERAAKEVKPGMHINLGIGIPTLIPAFVPAEYGIMLQSENGVIGVGDYPVKGEEDADLINAGKESVTVVPGAAYFSSSMSFDIIRGGHLDMTVLGSLQVSETGDIANWIIPGKTIRGMGGAMDLVASGSRVIVTMEHTAKGALKLLKQCTLPLTAPKVASMVITEKAVFENIDGKLVLTEVAKESSLEEVKKTTGFEIVAKNDIKRF